MCDFSLQAIKSRPAKVGDKLVTKNFGTGTTGFCDASDGETAICCLPGTELAFEQPVVILEYAGANTYTKHTVAVFAQVDKDIVHAHHDQLGFPDGSTAMLTRFAIGQRAAVLQLPAAPTTDAEREQQTRAAFAG